MPDMLRKPTTILYDWNDWSSLQRLLVITAKEILAYREEQKYLWPLHLWQIEKFNLKCTRLGGPSCSCPNRAKLLAPPRFGGKKTSGGWTLRTAATWSRWKSDWSCATACFWFRCSSNTYYWVDRNNSSYTVYCLIVILKRYIVLVYRWLEIRT